MKSKINYLALAFFIAFQGISQQTEKISIVDLAVHPTKAFKSSLIYVKTDETKEHLIFLSHTIAEYQIARRPYYSRFYNGKGQKHMFPYYKHNLPTIGELVVDTKTLEPVKNKIETFHPFTDLKDDEAVYFPPGDPVKLLAGIPGNQIKHNEKDAETIFYNMPVGLKESQTLYYFKTRGKYPVLKRASLTKSYDIHNGVVEEEKYETLKELKDQGFENYYALNLDDASFKDYIGVEWYQHKKDKSKYRIALYNAKTDQLTVKDFDFKVPRKFKTINKLVYDRNLNPKGFVTIFGYHRKGKKQKDIYPENRFDIIYIDFDGNEKIVTKVDYGTTDKYKNVLKPVFIIEEEDGSLSMVNEHRYSITKADYEVLSLDKNGNIEVKYTHPKEFEPIDNYKFYYARELSKKEPKKIGDFYIFEGKLGTTQYDNKGNAHSIDTGLNYIILNKDLQPVNIEIHNIENGKNGEIRLYPLEEDNHVDLVIKNGEVFLRKYSLDEENKLKIEVTPIKLDYLVPIDLEPEPILDAKNKIIYIFKLYYENPSKARAEKIGIAKIRY